MNKRIRDDIDTEREREDAQWGVQDHSDERWVSIITEELGEAARSINLHEGPFYTRKEIVHVAAVAVAWLEALDRQLPPPRRKP
jgi:hypothetical protein